MIQIESILRTGPLMSNPTLCSNREMLMRVQMCFRDADKSAQLAPNTSVFVCVADFFESPKTVPNSKDAQAPI